MDETVHAIARLHALHRAGATPLEKLFAGMTAAMKRPRFAAVTTAAIAAWIGWNLASRLLFGLAPFDPPPFLWLVAAAQIGALYVTLNILASQRREDELAELREQLALDLAILNEQKTAKIIHLLQELRRDLPEVDDPADAEAEAMEHPSDPAMILEAIKNKAVGPDLLEELEEEAPQPG